MVAARSGQLLLPCVCGAEQWQWDLGDRDSPNGMGCVVQERWHQSGARGLISSCTLGEFASEPKSRMRIDLHAWLKSRHLSQPCAQGSGHVSVIQENTELAGFYCSGSQAQSLKQCLSAGEQENFDRYHGLRMHLSQHNTWSRHSAVTHSGMNSAPRHALTSCFVV